jgi:serine/threonine protein kinase
MDISTSSPSIHACKDKIIKCSKYSIIYFDKNKIYKQYPLNQFQWVKEVGIVNYLNQTPNRHIIKFINCEVIDDYVIDTKNKEICLDKKEKVVRLTMHKYTSTLDNIKNFTDMEIFYIMNNLLESLLFCKSKHILHRDIKERNIFINYTTNNKNGKYAKNRIISELVLADFNISKYKYDIMQRGDIMTSTHRSPEIWRSMKNKKQLEYDERVDVWSFCVVLVYLITNHSFYEFLTNGYLKIDKTIVYSTTKMKIVMDHFINIYSMDNIVHIDFFKKIINMGIRPYSTRCTFNEIQNAILNYTRHTNIPITPKIIHQRCQITKPPETSFNRLFSQHSIWIKQLHEIIENNDIVLTTFYKNMTHIFKDSSNTNYHILIAVYILTSYIMKDTYKNLDFYIQKIHQMDNTHIQLKTHKHVLIFQNVTSKIVQTMIVNLLRTTKCNILY